MCDGWASSNVQLTAPLNPAQSSTLRFPGAPEGRGTSFVGGDGSRGGGATAALPTHPEAARRPVSRPAGRRRIDAESSAISVGFAGADGGDVGRIGVAVRADDVLAAVARLDVVVQHLPRDL